MELHNYPSVVVMFVVMKFVTYVDRLVVLLISFMSPQFEVERVYMSGVPVWCLEYAVMCTYWLIVGVVSLDLFFILLWAVS